ncbi:MAG: hypothetical protein DMG09_04870 [Acidobacteria bacterium]|nr:MAG: hypothetical protein DMG09_04870 [Acidobacteriota bacterium]
MPGTQDTRSATCPGQDCVYGSEALEQLRSGTGLMTGAHNVRGWLLERGMECEDLLPLSFVGSRTTAVTKLAARQICSRHHSAECAIAADGRTIGGGVAHLAGDKAGALDRESALF